MGKMLRFLLIVQIALLNSCDVGLSFQYRIKVQYQKTIFTRIYAIGPNYLALSVFKKTSSEYDLRRKIENKHIVSEKNTYIR